MAETHALSAGVAGDYGLEAAAAVLGEADVVIAVGTRLAPGDTIRQHPGLLNVHRQTLIQIDIEPRNVGWTHPVHCGLIGDAGTVMKELAARLKKRSVSASDGAARVRSAASQGFFNSTESDSDAVPILPQRVIKELGAVLPGNALVTSDAGENRIFMVHHFRSQSANSYFQPGSTGGMGYAVPAALGVKLARPDLPVVAVCGDGGFAMSLSGLMTALEEKLPITVVVMNNAMLGWVAHVQGERRIASHLGGYDYAAIARAIGCRGVRIEKPADLGAALTEAIASNQVSVVEVVTSPEQTWEQVVCKVRSPGG
jgi:acetolactate synthase-1/2/3 large subunit